MIKWLIHSARIEKEIMLKVGLRMVDSHEVEEVDMLLDSGATGLFIDCTWLCQNKITICKLEHPIEVYNIDGRVNREGSITEEVTLILSYQGHKGCTVFEVWNLILSLDILGYINTILRLTGKQQKLRWQDVWECNIAERRQKGIKKRRRGVGVRKAQSHRKLWSRRSLMWKFQMW